MEKKTIDNLDRKILNSLIENSRKAYAEIANELNVSPATIFVRVEKMREAGIILGNSLRLDPKMLGYDVCCFIGIILKSAKDYPQVLNKLKEINSVIEVYFTTGQYSIFIKIMCTSIHALQEILITKIQSIDEIQSTETLISLQNPIIRSIYLDEDL